MNGESVLSFVRVDKKLIADFIEKAQNRILIAKPSYFKEETEVIKKVIKEKIM